MLSLLKAKKSGADENQQAEQDDRTPRQSKYDQALEHDNPDHRALAERFAPSARGDRKRVAQEKGAFGGDQLAALNAGENLHVAVMLKADLDDALGEAAAVGGDPDASSCRRLRAPRHRAESRASASGSPVRDHEGREHAGAQLVLGICDLGAHQHAAGGRDRRSTRWW